MQFNNYKKLISTAIIAIILVLLSFNTVCAESSMADILMSAGETGAGFSTATGLSLSEYIGSIIQYILSFLGVIFICLIIYGGFLWMTAAGDSEQITKAKDIITSSIIGLVIILAAYTIVFYISYSLFQTVGIAYI